MSGTIYCFNTIENPNIIKAGHTQQVVQKRLRGYMGPTKPRSIIFTVKVDDSVEAEKMMLHLMEQCVSLKKRYDLGNEWFETTGFFSFEQRAKHLQTIARIVQKASNIIIPPSVPSVRDISPVEKHVGKDDIPVTQHQHELNVANRTPADEPDYRAMAEAFFQAQVQEQAQAEGEVEDVDAHKYHESKCEYKEDIERPQRSKRTINETNSSESEPEPPMQATSLRGLEEYFKRFDDFVAQEAAPSNVLPLILLRNYEASAFCPYLYQLLSYLPFSESERVNVTAQRYRDFLS